MNKFERRQGVKGYIGEDLIWRPFDATVKMSKSSDKTQNIPELSLETKYKAMENEKNYWKLRHTLLEKYSNV